MNLTRFDRQNEFNPLEIACLLCGVDPAETVSREKIANDLELMKKGLMNAFVFFKNASLFYDNKISINDCLLSCEIERIISSDNNNVIKNNSNFDKNPFRHLARNTKDDLEVGDESADPHGIIDEYLDYFSSDGFDESKFVRTKFSRHEIHRWLIARGYTSIYSFSNDDGEKRANENISNYFNRPVNNIDTKIDPEDLPAELDCANIAFRAIVKGHGDRSATFKNRLIEFLAKEYTSLSNEAVQRIATVANPDKAPGRKKF